MLVRAFTLRIELLMWMSFDVYREITRPHVSIWKTRYRRPWPKRGHKWYLNIDSDYLMVIIKWYVLRLGRTSKCANYRTVAFVTTRTPLGKLKSAEGLWQPALRRIRLPP